MGYQLDNQVKPSTRRIETELWFTEEPNGPSDTELKFIPRDMIVDAKAPSGIP